MEELIRLEKSGKYLFHGSSDGDILELEPRQPWSHRKKDGHPCVAASDIIEPPIFMAVLGSKKLGGWEKDPNDDKQVRYYVTKNDMEKAKKEEWHGYVYILKKDSAKFRQHKGFEWRSSDHVKPIKRIRVGLGDLPSNIRFIDDYSRLLEG